jgi:hypothetical protein
LSIQLESTRLDEDTLRHELFAAERYVRQQSCAQHELPDLSDSETTVAEGLHVARKRGSKDDRMKKRRLGGRTSSLTARVNSTKDTVAG